MERTANMPTAISTGIQSASLAVRPRITMTPAMMPSTAAARSQLRNVQRSRSRFGTKGRVHPQAFADRVECFAVALRCQEPINKLLSEAIGIAGIGPRNHAIPDPAKVLDCVTA